MPIHFLSRPTALAGVALLGLGPTPAVADPGSLAELLAARVSAESAHRHLVALQRAADDHGGTRASGTPGYQASADYVRRALEAAGYRVRAQPFSYADWGVITEEAAVEGPAARTLHPLMGRFSLNTPAEGLSAPVTVLPPDDPTPGCEPADYAGTAGRIALVRYGPGCTSTDRQRLAAQAGAVALLINTDQAEPDMNFRLRVNPPSQARLPMAILSRRESERLGADAAGGTVVVRLLLQGKEKQTDTFNLTAETTTGDPANTVMLGAHLDSAEEGPGINDNGSSAAMVLETALRLAPLKHQVKNRVRFAWWGGEEKGLLGSLAYVGELTAEQRHAIALYLNYDLIGSPNFVRIVLDGDDSEHTGTGPGPAGSGKIEQVLRQYFTSRRLPTEPGDLDGRSDYAAFTAAGIPAGGGSSGASETKTAEEQRIFGGAVGHSYDACYHQPCDDLNNINPVVFDQFGDSMAWALGRFAVSVADVRTE